VGFAGAPRFVGWDDRDREILTFMPGHVAVKRGGDPLPGYVRSETTLKHLARLTREFHDATVDFKAPEGATWSFLRGAPRHQEVICHNDIGPWNTVFRKGLPVAFIDWDGAAPAPRMWDVACAVYRIVPFRPGRNLFDDPRLEVATRSTAPNGDLL
jgi:Ser/Thr protein kinase RdoA (MazF antagonist)